MKVLKVTTPRKSRQNPAIRDFILRNVEGHSADVAAITTKQFGVTRQSINRYLNRLEEDQLLEGTGKTNARRYALKSISAYADRIEIVSGIQENDVWAKYVEPYVKDVPQNVKDICYYGFSEMFNNVIDHSQAPYAIISYDQTYAGIQMMVLDHGVGIFEKIQKDFDLADQRTALLELAKGKLTSDQQHHSGEGIFFTSRMFDEFSLRSGNLYYRKQRKDDWGWLIETQDFVEHYQGTVVTMKISTDANWNIQQVFEKFTAKDDEISFVKTHVPLFLGKYGSEQLVSRSQAKRILARFDRFQEILLDFADVPIIGQPFADEIFRVFQNQHPEILIVTMHTTPEVDRTIAHVKGQSGGLVPDSSKPS
jgi:anti-sigma regulatory factor (Ser/Thr protein kinase)